MSPANSDRRGPPLIGRHVHRDNATENGAVVPYEGFAYDQIDGHGVNSPPDGAPDGAEIIRRVLDFVLEGSLAPGAVGLRAIVLAKIIEHPRLHGRTLKSIGDEAGLTKAGVSRAAVALSDRLGLHRVWQRNDAGRERMAEAMRQSHARRKGGAIDEG